MNLRSLSRRLHRDERGQTIVVLTLMFVVLLGFTALVVDVGIAYWNRRLVQNGVDSAALAGAVTLMNGATTPTVVAVVQNYANANGVTTQELNNVTEPAYKVQVATTFNDNDTVVVSARRHDDFGLRYLIGAGDSEIVASAAAIVGAAQPDGLWPMAIFDTAASFQKCTTPPNGCQPKEGAPPDTAGNFGYVVLPGMGNGSNNVEQAILYRAPAQGVPTPIGTATPEAGFPPGMEVYSWGGSGNCQNTPPCQNPGNKVNTYGAWCCGNPSIAYWDQNKLCQGGQSSCANLYTAPPSDGFNYAPLTPDGTVCWKYTSCPRVGIVPIVDPSTWGNGRNQITIVGFACFYMQGVIQGTGNGHDAIQGHFLNFCSVSSGEIVYGSPLGGTGSVTVALWR